VLLTAALTCGLAMGISSWKSQHDQYEIPIIAVMGKTGAGKSSFIDALGGRHAVSRERPDIGHGLGSSNTRQSIHNGALC
jgi:predicted GTPase